MTICFGLVLFIDEVPVSYTHLDVYKRQAFQPYGIPEKSPDTEPAPVP